jgi:peroxiredoxin
MKFTLILVNIIYYLFAGGYKIGDCVKNFSIINTDSSKINLSDFHGSSGVVLIFSDPDCPYSRAYLNRMQSVSAECLKNNIQCLFIVCEDNQDNSDSLITEWNLRKNIKFLKDYGFSLADEFEITRYPETVVLKNVKGNFVLHYRGALDDNPQCEKEVNHRYLSDAITSIKSGNTLIVNEKRPVGCIIR